MSTLDNTERNTILYGRNIGARYHNFTLTGYPHPKAPKLAEAIKALFKANNAKELGLTIVGESKESYDMSYLVAKAVNLMGKTCYVYNMHELLDKETLDDIAAMGYPPLFIIDFLPTELTVDVKSYKRLESILKVHYLNKNTALYVHIPIPYSVYESSIADVSLFNNNFLPLINNNNMVVAV